MAMNPEATSRIEIIVEKQNGEKLVGTLHHATGSSRDVIVLCHGFRSASCKESRTIVKIAEALEKEQISAFRFDFSGNGKSDGEWSYSNHLGEVEDLRAVILHLTQRGHRVSAVLGHSKGGNVVLLYASKYADIPAVINLSARFDLKEGLKERFGENLMETLERDGYIDIKQRNGTFDYRLTLKCIMDRHAINVKESCSHIHKDCRVLTVHGSRDEYTPVEDAFEFDKVIPNHQVQIIKDANHCYTRHKDELMKVILSFLRDISSEFSI